MPPPSSENDLKRRARRRLIGAVALTLLAVIVLPLLLEDEPPPASSLVVRMAEAPVPEPLVQPGRTDPPEAVDVPAQPALSQPAPQPAAQARPAPEPAKPASPKPASLPEAVKSTPKPQPSQSKPAASSEVFVVQLAALSDSAKAQTLKTRAIRAGFPAYSDSLGTLTRVRVGPYMSREAAEVAAEKLAKQGISGGQVLIK